MKTVSLLAVRSEKERKNALQEVRLLQVLNHPNVVAYKVRHTRQDSTDRTQGERGKRKRGRERMLTMTSEIQQMKGANLYRHLYGGGAKNENERTRLRKEGS